MTCEFVSRANTSTCRVCGLVLGALGPADCPRRLIASLPADVLPGDVLPVVSAAPGGPVVPSRPGRPSVSQIEHLTAPP